MATLLSVWGEGCGERIERRDGVGGRKRLNTMYVLKAMSLILHSHKLASIHNKG